jgi:hypothetical protein
MTILFFSFPLNETIFYLKINSINQTQIDQIENRLKPFSDFPRFIHQLRRNIYPTENQFFRAEEVQTDVTHFHIPLYHQRTEI